MKHCIIHTTHSSLFHHGINLLDKMKGHIIYIAVSLVFQAFLLTTTIHVSNAVNQETDNEIILTMKVLSKNSIVEDDLRHKNMKDGSIDKAIADHTNIRRSSYLESQMKSKDRAQSFVAFENKNRDLDHTCDVCTRDWIHFRCPSGYVKAEWQSDGVGGWGTWSDALTSTCYENSCCSNNDADFLCCESSSILRSCDVCNLENLYYDCPDGYEPDYTSNGLWGTYTTSTVSTCLADRCCSDQGATASCCKLAPAPIPVPVRTPAPVPVPRPQSLSLPTSAPVTLPVQPVGQPAPKPMGIYIALGAIIPVIIALTIAVVCLVKKNKKTQENNNSTTNKSSVDHTAVEPTNSGQTPSQATPIKIISIAQSHDAPTSFSTMQYDDVSMMSEDYLSKSPLWSSGNSNVESQPGRFVPIVQGSIVADSVMTTH
jgi:hypothetical protein